MLTEHILEQKLEQLISYLREEKYEDLKRELRELGMEFLKEKEEFVRNADLKLLIVEMREGFKRMEDRFEAMDKRFQELVHYVDKRFEAVDKRFEAVDKRFQELIHYVDKRFEDVNKRFEEMHKRINFIQWLIVFLTTFLFSVMTYYHKEEKDLIIKTLEQRLESKKLEEKIPEK